MVCQKAILRKHPALAGKDVPLQDIQTLEDTRSMNAHLVATSRADVYKATTTTLLIITITTTIPQHIHL